MILAKSNWIAFPPIFYDENTGANSTNINDLLRERSIEPDWDGLCDYLDFGYSVFSRTPIKGIRFLPANSVLELGDDGRVSVYQEPDPVLPWLDQVTPEADAIAAIRSWLGSWSQAVGGRAVLPISGGLDSRMLACLLPEGHHSEAFTYGLSFPQHRSSEVVRARRLCQRYSIAWQHITLRHVHRHIPLWLQRFGPSTHCHGMYQMDFYHRIAKATRTRALLSGIIGDIWAGSLVTNPVRRPSELRNLGYTHGMNAPPCSVRKRVIDQREQWFEQHREHLHHPLYRIVLSMRQKIMLLGYLFSAPALNGFSADSPFLDLDIAMRMLTIDPARRDQRLWQQDFVAQYSPLSETRESADNSLNLQNRIDVPHLSPLPVNCLAKVVDARVVRAVNHLVAKPSRSLPACIACTTPRLRVHMHQRGATRRQRQAYATYLTLKPLVQDWAG